MTYWDTTSASSSNLTYSKVLVGYEDMYMPTSIGTKTWIILLGFGTVLHKYSIDSVSFEGPRI